MIKKDDRTPEERTTHVWGVVALDRCMSGWGGAAGGVSRCAWACPPDGDLSKLEQYVRGRTEMRYVNVVNLNTYRPRAGTAHYHIYVADKGEQC